MSATQDYVALDWIKGEISQTLEQAQYALEAVAASADDSSSMRSCLTAIHQVHGTLKMVQLAGPTQIAAEMEELAQGLMGKSIADVGLAQETLMQSILQMPGYLDRIHREQQDSPAFVELLVNELRIARGEAPLASSTAMSAAKAMPDWFAQEADVIDQAAFEADRGAATVRKLRQHYQQALNALLKKENPRENLNLLGKVFTRLEKLCGQSAMANLFQLGLAVIEGVSAGAIRLDGALANQLKAIDGELKRLGELGVSGLGKTSADLGQGLLARVRDASKETPRITAAKARFLQDAAAVAAPASNTNFGPDDETLAAVANILIEELTGITDKLDLYVRSGSRSKQLIVDLVPGLKQIASTLLVVGLDEHQQTVLQQLELIEQIEAQADDAQDEQLIEMARAFLQIESSLRSVSGTTEDAGADSFGDLNEAQASVLRETRNGLAQARDVVVAFVTAEFDQTKLEGVAANLRNLRGGLSMVNQDRAGDVLLACAAYIDAELVGALTPPGLDVLDDLADAMTSVDYYLERLLESASDPYLQMLEVAEAAVAKLGYDVEAVLAARRKPEATVTSAPAALAASEEDGAAELLTDEAEEALEAPIEEPIEESVEELVDELPVADELAAEDDFAAPSQADTPLASMSADVLEEASVDDPDDLIDDEILEIFAEEAVEVLETINEYYPRWRADRQDENPLMEIRRAFHTLKGSGRMVGATVMGEFAWSVENLLNRVLDGTVDVSDGIFVLLDEVISKIPEGLAAFEAQHQETFDPSDLVRQAQAYAAGEMPAAEPEVAELESDEIETGELPAEDDDSLAAELARSESALLAAEALQASLDAGELPGTTEIEEPETDNALDLESPASVAPEEHSEAETELPDELAELDFELEPFAAESLDDEPVTETPVNDEQVQEGDLQEDDLQEDDLQEDDLQEEDQEEDQEENHFQAESLQEDALQEEPQEDLLEDAPLAGALEDDELATASTLVDMPTIEPAVPGIDQADGLMAADGDSLESDLSESDMSENDMAEDEPAPAPSMALNLDDFDIEEIEVPSSLVEFDEELLEIFTLEAHEKLRTIEAYLANPVYVPTDLVAAFHTLKGSAGMANVSSIAEIAAPLEKLCQRTHGAGLPPTAEMNALIQRGADLIARVLADLHSLSESVPGINELLRDLTALNNTRVESSEPEGFDFAGIKLLSGPFEDLGEWQTTNVSKIITELETAEVQADILNQHALRDLITAMLQLYGKLQSRPSSAVLELLVTAHEALVIMFDHIAASQDIAPATDIISALAAVDLQQMQADIEADQFAEDAWALLAQVGHSLAEWQADISLPEPLQALQHQLSSLGEHAEAHDRRPMASLLEAMIQLAEGLGGGQLSADAGDPQLFEAGRSCLAEQLIQIQQAQPLASDDELLGRLRNRLQTSSSVPTGAAVEEAPLSLLPADEIDLDVLPLFLEEAEELIESIDQCILDWSADTSKQGPLDNLLRHLHTIKGGARLAGLNTLGEVTHDTETFLTEVQHNPAALDDQFFNLLNQRQDDISRRVTVYQGYVAGVVNADALAALRQPWAPGGAQQPPADVEEMASDLHQEGPEDDIDEEILAIFIEEADELLEAIDQCIHNWSEDAAADTHLNLLLRHLHTLKGGARLAGLNSLGDFAHDLESFLSGFQQRHEQPDEAFFAYLNQQQDELTRRIEVYTKLVAGEASQEELASLAQPAVLPDAAMAPSANQDASAATVPAVAADGSADDAAGPLPGQSSQGPEMVRVSSELLGQLINLAGESSITRGRIEQQIADFGGAIEEMEDTIDRIREQVRRLEIEAESRETVFRSRQSVEGDSAFDELEMDRYTLLQDISRTLNEGSSDMMDLKDTLLNKSRDTETLLHQQARISAELQEGLTRTHMVPFARLIPRLRRIVRQISTEVGKSVRFDAFNVEGELDRNVLERIVAPLEHMLRNAVDHGIESAEQRRSANKPETGRISLRLSREGGYVVLTVSDDGAGINVAAVKAKAIERGLITAETSISDHEVRQFIMHAGFSTAAKLTQISGRGVGMDVVNSEIKQLGGSLTIDSTIGRGTQFIIRIPFTVSINRALMVIVKEEVYAVPLNTIEGIVRVSPYELEAYYQPDAPMFEYAGQPYRLAYMGKMLERSDNPTFDGQLAALPVILARSGDTAVAMQVDRVIGSREVVVKTLGRQFSEVGGISGATVLGDGSVVIILDIMALVRTADAVPVENRRIEVVEPEARIRTVMIVDDSVTVRKVTSRLMERHGWEVLTAKDGVDALNQLQDVFPDMVLLDIEMPRMDGFEVLRAVRRDERLKSLPIIMITSRTGEKHQQQAFELGVNGFLGKPFQEAGLMSSIEDVLAAVQEESA